MHRRLGNVAATLRRRQQRCFSTAGPNVTTPAAAAPVIDGMDRYPHLNSSRGILRGIDYLGTWVFAASGAITAATHGMDLLGAVAVGTITACGGGTVRDIVVFARPPFWSGPDGETEYLWMSAAAAIAGFYLYPEYKEAFESRAMDWTDALCIGAFGVIGAQNGIRGGLSPALCVLCGMSTGTFGGATRDVLTKRPVRIFHSYAEIYATTAAGAAAAYLCTRALALPLGFRIGAGISTAVAMRYCAWTYGLRLPSYESMGWSEHLAANKKQ